MLYSDLNVVLDKNVTSVTYTKEYGVDTNATLLVPPSTYRDIAHVTARNGRKPSEKIMKKYIFYVCWYFRDDFNSIDGELSFIEALNDILRQDAEKCSKMLFDSVSFKYPEDWESKHIYVCNNHPLSCGYNRQFYIPLHGLDHRCSLELKAFEEGRLISSSSMTYADLNVKTEAGIDSAVYTYGKSDDGKTIVTTILIPVTLADRCLTRVPPPFVPTRELRIQHYIKHICSVNEVKFNTAENLEQFAAMLNDALLLDSKKNFAAFIESWYAAYPDGWQQEPVFKPKNKEIPLCFRQWAARPFVIPAGVQDINNYIPCGILNSSLKKLLKTQLKLADHGYTISVLDIDISDDYDSVQFDFPVDETLEGVSIKVGIPNKVIELAKLAVDVLSLVIPRYLSYVYHHGKDTLKTGSTLCAYKASLNKLFEDDAKSGFYKLGEVKHKQDWKKVIPYYKSRDDE